MLLRKERRNMSTFSAFSDAEAEPRQMLRVILAFLASQMQKPAGRKKLRETNSVNYLSLLILIFLFSVKVC